MSEFIRCCHVNPGDTLLLSVRGHLVSSEVTSTIQNPCNRIRINVFLPTANRDEFLLRGQDTLVSRESLIDPVTGEVVFY